MKFKALGLVAVILTVSLFVQTLFVWATVAYTADLATVEYTADQSSDSARIARFETMLESLREELKIPAYSAAIVKDQKVIWAKGFGYADVENKIPATEHTPCQSSSSRNLLLNGTNLPFDLAALILTGGLKSVFFIMARSRSWNGDGSTCCGLALPLSGLRSETDNVRTKTIIMKVENRIIEGSFSDRQYEV